MTVANYFRVHIFHFCFVMLFVLAGQLPVTAQRKPGFNVDSMISPDALHQHLSVIAGDEMEGRAAGSFGQRKTADYIIQQFKRSGLQPGDGNSFEQRYTVYRHAFVQNSISIRGKKLEEGRDYFFPFPSNWYYARSRFATLHISKPDIVFAGYGVVDSANKLNDFAGLNLKGKLVMVLHGLPPESGSSSRTGTYFYKLQAVKDRGAVGLIVLYSDLYQSGFPAYTWDGLEPADGKEAALLVNASEAMGASILRAPMATTAAIAKMKKASYAVPIDISLKIRSQMIPAVNVIGVLEGSERKEEYVVLTAHYDHLGKSGKDIFYGADDDGSGTAALLQVAATFGAAAKAGWRPKRSILFLAVSGEEIGLFGSEHFVGHPTIPLKNITANLNTDMIGRIDPERKKADSLNYLYVIGHNRISSELEKLADEVNEKHGKLRLDYKFDDGFDPDRIFYRSDHYNFASKGVPILFFFDGMLSGDYHSPGDTIDKINFDLMSRRTQLIFHIAWTLAGRDGLLVRDLAID